MIAFTKLVRRLSAGPRRCKLMRAMTHDVDVTSIMREVQQLVGLGRLPSPAQVAAVQALVSGDWIASAASQAPTLFIASDSIVAQGFRPPSSAYGVTTGRGSYSNVGTNTRGVTNVYAENPVRFKFRAAHLLTTGDEIYFEGGPSGFALTHARYTVTVTAADELTLDGIDGTSLTEFSSAGAATDGMAYIDMAYADFGPLTWALSDLGYPFARIDGCMRPGATTAKVAAQIAAARAGNTYTHGILWAGRNDAAWDEASTILARDAMLAGCGYVLAVITYPDNTAGMTADMLAKLKSIGDFWYSQQASNPRIKVFDAFGVVSDPVATNEAALPGLLASDGTHPQANGARRMGRALAAVFPPITIPKRALSRVGSGSANLLTGGRFTALTGGTLGGVLTGSAVANWGVGQVTVGRSTNLNGKYVQGAVTPAVQRRASTAYVQGDIIDIGDGYWYLVKTGGTTAASLPAGYATATLFDYATGVTDGAAAVFRLPKWTSSLERVAWQYIDASISSDSGSEFIAFRQSISLPGAVTAGSNYVRGQADVAVLGGVTKGITTRLIISDSVPAQIACAHGHAILTTLTAPVGNNPKVETSRTRAIKVGATAATLELMVRAYLPVEGCQFVIANPMLEKVSAPGVID